MNQDSNIFFETFCSCNSFNDIAEDQDNQIIKICYNCNKKSKLSNGTIIIQRNTNDYEHINTMQKDDNYQHLQLKCKVCNNLDHVCIRHESVNCIYMCMNCDNKIIPSQVV